MGSRSLFVLASDAPPLSQFVSLSASISLSFSASAEVCWLSIPTLELCPQCVPPIPSQLSSRSGKRQAAQSVTLSPVVNTLPVTGSRRCSARNSLSRSDFKTVERFPMVPLRTVSSRLHFFITVLTALLSAPVCIETISPDTSFNVMRGLSVSSSAFD